MQKIIFATGNQGKLKEIKAVLGDRYEVVSMKEAGYDIDIEETGSTFEENAVIKAQAIMKASNTLVLADDSGLEIDYLDKAPGIYSARYLGEDTPYSIKNQHILDLLKDVEEEKRTARFVSVISAVYPNGKILTARATIEGMIGYEIKGENGFGYDPIFYLPSLGKTTAELTLEEKNEISHRGKALRLMRERLTEYENSGIE